MPGSSSAPQTINLTQRRLRREWRRPVSEAIRERNAQVLHHLGLAHLAAQRQRGRGRGEYEDLLQEAHLGLIRAAERFDSSKGCKISSYVVPLATGQIRHYRRDREQCLRIPWRLSDLHAQGARLQQRRQQEQRAALTDRQMAEALGVRPERWLQARIAHQHKHLLSLQERVGQQDQSLGQQTDEALIDQLLAPTDSADGDAQLQWLQQALKELPNPMRRWLIDRHVHGMTVQAIATTEGVSAHNVRRAITRCLEDLRRSAAIANLAQIPLSS